MPERHLILGGARSGKTNHAITLAASRAAARGERVVYVATAQALDAEMQDRIARHRAERPTGWQTLEAPDRLAATLRAQAPAILLIDCLTLWLSNVTEAGADAAEAAARVADLLSAARARDGRTVLVTNEVGMGIVPAYASGRRFRDDAGTMNQALAAAADRVFLVVAGLELRLK